MCIWLVGTCTVVLMDFGWWTWTDKRYIYWLSFRYISRVVLFDSLSTRDWLAMTSTMVLRRSSILKASQCASMPGSVLWWNRTKVGRCKHFLRPFSIYFSSFFFYDLNIIIIAWDDASPPVVSITPLT